MKKIIDRLKKLCISLFCVIMSLLVKRNDKYLAFGSWKGKMFIDNSRYLFERALEALGEDYRFIWIGNEDLKGEMPHDSRITLVKKNSCKSISLLLRCKYMFCSQFHFEDLCDYNVYHGAVMTYLHHGYPIKKWGLDTIGATLENRVLHKIMNNILSIDRKYEYFISSSPDMSKTLLTALKDKGCKETNILMSGTPRNDFLLSNKHRIDYYKDKYSKLLGYDKNKKVILYLPTFRRTQVGLESIYMRKNLDEYREIKKLLIENNTLLIEKAHFADESGYDNCEKSDTCHIHLTKNVNVQELLLCADVLISDYSGAFIDYLLLDRPIIHYLFDYEYYRDVDSGLYYDKEEFMCGYVATTYAELLKDIKSTLNKMENGEDLRKNRRKRFTTYEVGNASSYILHKVIGKKE